MVEFGEKVKKLREEKGMTQQTMADQLYVTRQAVSRWECGARFPDLLTAKKIAQILEVSVDELLSGEELKKSIERDPVLSAPVSNMIQRILYAVASAAYLLMLVFSLYSFYPAQALKGTPARKITAINVITAVGYLINLCALAAGLVFSARNSLSAAKTGAADASMAESSTSIVNSEIPCFTNLFIKLLLIHSRPQKPVLFSPHPRRQ